MAFLLLLFTLSNESNIQELYVKGLITATENSTSILLLTAEGTGMRAKVSLVLFDKKSRTYRLIDDARIPLSPSTSVISWSSSYLLADLKTTKFIELDANGELGRTFLASRLEGFPSSAKILQMTADDEHVFLTVKNLEEPDYVHLLKFSSEFEDLEFITSHWLNQEKAMNPYWLSSKEGWLLVTPETGRILLQSEEFSNDRQLAKGTEAVLMMQNPSINKMLIQRGASPYGKRATLFSRLQDGSYVFQIATFEDEEKMPVMRREPTHFLSVDQNLSRMPLEVGRLSSEQTSSLVFDLLEGEFRIQK